MKLRGKLSNYLTRSKLNLTFVFLLNILAGILCFFYLIFSLTHPSKIYAQDTGTDYNTIPVLQKILKTPFLSEKESDMYTTFLTHSITFNPQETDLVFAILDSTQVSSYAKSNILNVIGKKGERNFDLEIRLEKFISKSFELLKKDPNYLLKVMWSLSKIKPINSNSHYLLLRPFFMNVSLFDPELFFDYKKQVLINTKNVIPSSKDSFSFTELKKLYLKAFYKETDEEIQALFVENLPILGMFDELYLILSNPKFSNILKTVACVSTCKVNLPPQVKNKLSVSLEKIVLDDKKPFVLQKYAQLSLMYLKKNSTTACQKMFSCEKNS